MKRWILFLVLGVMLIVFGCATTSQDKPIRCPKCGAYFTTKEGADAFHWMMGPRETRR